ncbi:MAG: hypothetical protein IT328_22980 [Caldilineaceae bacterium]|nr:hypothetical protein [Caldilineaceae bacterium]
MSNDTKDSKSYSNFVPALREPPRQIIEVDVTRELPATPSTVLLPQAGYEDRARGFSIATGPLAGVAGLVAALVGILGWQVPIASLITLLLALGGFALVWLIAYLGHVFISPDGTMFLHTILAWGYLRREQRERFKRYREVKRGE